MKTTTYIFHNNHAIKRPPIPMLDRRYLPLRTTLKQLLGPFQRNIHFDVLVGNLLDLQRDPDPLCEGTGERPEKLQVGFFGVALRGHGGEAGWFFGLGSRCRRCLGGRMGVGVGTLFLGFFCFF